MQVSRQNFVLLLKFKRNFPWKDNHSTILFEILLKDLFLSIISYSSSSSSSMSFIKNKWWNSWLIIWQMHYIIDWSLYLSSHLTSTLIGSATSPWTLMFVCMLVGRSVINFYKSREITLSYRSNCSFLFLEYFTFYLPLLSKHF